jgi:hypothetical protein
VSELSSWTIDFSIRILNITASHQIVKHGINLSQKDENGILYSDNEISCGDELQDHLSSVLHGDYGKDLLFWVWGLRSGIVIVIKHSYVLLSLLNFSHSISSVFKSMIILIQSPLYQD